ncbi:TPA: hypothetical protein HA351_09855 [Methanosarcinaceae archaeon]|nr:hypothetical protein [Methanosarcinaceae archaeon]
MTEGIDELDAYFAQREEPSEERTVKQEHIMMEKIAINPARRKILRIVGIYGKSPEQLKEESELSDFFFKYHMDLLLGENILKLEEGTYRLTKIGIGMHDSVC